jgi:hypothetical protein
MQNKTEEANAISLPRKIPETRYVIFFNLSCTSSIVDLFRSFDNRKMTESNPKENLESAAAANAEGSKPSPQKKRSPHRLVVEEATNDDNSIIALSPAKMEELGLFRGDNVLVKGMWPVTIISHAELR